MIDSYNAYLLTAIKLFLPYLIVCFVVALVMVKKRINLPNSTSTNSTNSKNLLLWKWWCQTCWTGFLLLIFTLTIAFVVIEASCPVVRFYQRYYSTNGNINGNYVDNSDNYNCEVIACDYFLLYASIVSVVFVAYIAFNICGSQITKQLSKLRKLKLWLYSRSGERAPNDHLSKINERADDLRGIRFE